MALTEEEEEGGPPSEATLPGKHDSQTKPKSPVHQERPDSPAPGCEPMKTDQCMEIALTSKDTEQRTHQERPDSPVPSCVSMKSDHSIGRFLDFKDGHPSTEQRDHQERSEVLSGQSVQEHQTDLDSIFMLLEENLVTFVTKELKGFQKVLISDYPECLERQREEEEEQRRSTREALLKITLHFLRSMKQEELAASLESNPSPVQETGIWAGMYRGFYYWCQQFWKSGEGHSQTDQSPSHCPPQ
ncbi:uncharacterized protein LOC130125946 isoform X2 [Lampris incognitus]|uniref:uncharacterized protein LOC130125946 isoform X2 n=1 Tax=Lampris incognitus TaxID=2546036 RepID=UPI0024B4842A|nr:uncharacterized protein LOC130125946 isoform X2 [Lampris incognitus]